MGATPYTTIKLMRRYPCGPDYENTLYFANVVAQTNYMDTLVFKTFTNQSFQRPSRGRIRLQIAFTDSETVNYLAWNGKKNPNVASDVWYYAFVTGVKYINEAVTEFEYQIDIIQTYWWLVTLRRCLVERETVASDELYEHLIDEGLSVSQYDDGAPVDSPAEITNFILVVAATFDLSYNDVSAGRVNGLFSGLAYNTFQLTDTGMQAAINFVKGAADKGKTDGIVSIFYAPSFIFGSFGSTINTVAMDLNKGSSIRRSNGSTVHNNKLHSYPYSYLLVSNNTGDTEAFRYEMFKTEKCGFIFTGDSTCSPGLILMPSGYANPYQFMGISGYPYCSYTNDTYKAWLAQNAANFVGNKVSSETQYAYQVARSQENYQMAWRAQQNAYNAGDVMGYEQASSSMQMSQLSGILGLAGMAATAIQAIGEVTQMANLPNTAKGVGSTATLFSANKLQFTFYYRVVHSKYVDAIDDFFDMYGYKINVTKIPDTHSRPHWNYVKTINCDLVGYASNNVLSQFKAIFNKGIRFWRNGAEVGQYNLNNRPVSAQVADGTMSVEEAKAYEA